MKPSGRALGGAARRPASRVLLAFAAAAAAASALGCSSCRQLGDCGRDQCIQQPVVRDCTTGQTWNGDEPTACAAECAPDGGCPDEEVCVSRCAILSTGDNYDRTVVNLDRVCLPRDETDGGS